MKSYIKAETFIDNFNPYRNKYTAFEYSPLFDMTDWTTKNKYLTKELILKALLESLTIGYFITNTTQFIAIDIDDHRNNGEGYLLNVYNQILQKVKVKPSLLFKSPRGLHAYYFFSQRIPTDIILKITKEKLKQIRSIEIKPTQNTALRIPAEKKAIDPETLQLLNISFDDCIKKCHKYHPAELFDNDILPANIKQSLTEKRQSIKKLKAIPKIEAIENDLIPFINGVTNESFLKLCNVYRCNGLDIDDAFYRFQLCLQNSPFYTGDLRNPKRLLLRIESEYKNNEYIPQIKPVTPNIFTGIIANNVIKKSPFAKQRNKPLQIFVEKLLIWKEYQDEIFLNKRELAIWDYLYPYYRKNRKEGLYPLPFGLMRKWNFRCHEIIKYFCEINFLTPSSYKYNVNLGVCKYYFINDDLFNV